jgi:TRAP-type transport system periplasmic protein
MRAIYLSDMLRRAIGCFLALLPAVALPARAATWELLAPYAATDFETRNLEQFAAEVAEASAGALRIVVLADPARFDSATIRRTVATGQMPAGEFLLSEAGGGDLFEVDAVPFLARDYDQALALWDASRPVLERKLKDGGLRIAFVVPRPPKALFVDRQIWSMEDLRGLKLLDDAPMIRPLAVLIGAEPTPVPPGTTVDAFARGLLDAELVSIPAGIAQGARSFVRYVYDVRAALPKGVVAFNSAAHAALDAETQRALLNAAVAAQNRGWQASGSAHNEGIDLLRGDGVTVAALEPGVAEGLAGAGATLANEWAARAGPDGRVILDAYRLRRR